MKYSTKMLKHDLSDMNKKLHEKNNNPYRIKKHNHDLINLVTQDNPNHIGKIIVVSVSDAHIMIHPDKPFPSQLLYKTIPHPNSEIIRDLNNIFIKYQTWYFEHPN